MSQGQKQWLLKVIVGPHQGAEISLDEGKTLIGSDDDCDVVLHDVLIAPQHLALEFTRNGIVVVPLGGRVYANGKRLKESRHTIADFTILSIGSSHFVVGPQDVKWPLLSAADVPELEKETAEEAASSDESAKDAQDSAAADSAETVTADATASASTGKPNQKRPLAWIGVAFGVIVLVAWFFVWQQFMPSPLADADTGTPLEMAHEILEKTGTDSSIKLDEQFGKITASGYVDTDAKQRELQTALREAVPGIRTRVWSLERVTASARSLLAAQGLPLAVASMPEGELRITGTVTDGESWNRVKQLLLVEIPGLSGVDDRVQIQATRPAIITSSPAVVRETEIKVVSAPFIESTPSNSSSEVTPAQAQAPDQMPALVSVPSSPAAAPEKPVEEAAKTSWLDSPESTVTLITPDKAGLGWFKLNTGGVYFTGGELPFGGTVTKIASEAVTITENKNSRAVKQGDRIVPAAKTKPAEPSPELTNIDSKAAEKLP